MRRTDDEAEAGKVASSRVGPLSLGQRALWIFDQLHPRTPIHNVTASYRISGPLDVGRLEESLRRIADRHEILRTIFPSVAGEPVQVVQPTARIDLPLTDLEGLAPRNEHERTGELLAAVARTPFDLERGPLVRAQLLRLSDDRHVLALAIHHIAVDAWSFKRLFRELGHIYAALGAGEQPKLPPLAMQYLDHALSERERARSDEFARQLAYWKQHLSGELPVLDLSRSHARSRGGSYEGALSAFEFPESLVRSLRTAAPRLGVTPFVVALTAFKVLLYRYTGQPDLVVGIPEAGRRLPDVEELIGFFVNPLPVRTRLYPEASFAEAARRVEASVTGGLANYLVPLQAIVDALDGHRSGRGAPFQAMFNLILPASLVFDVGDLRFEQMHASDVDPGTSTFDLSLALKPSGKVVTGLLEYNTQLFDEADARRAGAHYVRLLESAVHEPERPIARLTFLSDDEARAAQRWARHPEPLPPTAMLAHELFEQCVRANGAAIAITAGGSEVTYDQLNRGANRLARHLRDVGVGPDSVVGLLMERSIDLVSTMLAVLKSGGAFAPLSPDQPVERLRGAMRDAAMSHVIAADGVAFAPPAGVRRISPADAADHPGTDADLDRIGAPDHAAYVIFTSGSHGGPKGVVVEHRSFTSYIRAALERYGWLPTDRVLQFCAPTFDGAIEEVFLTLSCGGNLVLRRESMLASIEGFLRDCDELAISILSLPTAYWKALVAGIVETRLALPRSLRQVVIGGERAPVDLARAWRSHVGADVVVLNTYGPTETTVVATCFDMAALRDDASTVPIGRPLRNARVYLADEHGNLLPPNLPGEICIAGPCVARGYVGRPELTSRSFVPNPVNPDDGARMYRTGDIGVLRDNGNIEFLGRRDHEVKVRGFRVALEEVEAALARYPAVREAVVVPQPRPHGATRLVAYVTLSTATFEASALREHASTLLPDYMIPAQVCALGVMPRTASGKPDRQALAAMEAPSTEGALEQAPEDENQRILATTWCKVLGVPSIGIHDNYFDLGGDSIAALRIVSEVRRKGVLLNANDVFECQTIAVLAGRVQRASDTLPSAPVNAGLEPLTPVQLRFLTTTPREHRDHFSQSLVWNVEGDLQSELMRDAAAAVVTHHPALRTRFVFEQGRWWQSAGPVHDGFFVELPGDEAHWRAQLQELAGSLDVERGDVIRVACARGGDGRGRVAVIAHHLVVDVVSWQVVLQDLMDAYEQRAGGQAVRLPAPSSTTGAWAAYLAAYGQSDLAIEALQHWLERPESAPRRLAPNADGGGFDSDRILGWSMSAAETRALRELSIQRAASLEDCCLTAVVSAVREICGAADVYVDVEHHGRGLASSGIDLSRSVGWFTSVFPVWFPLEQSADPDAVLDVVASRMRAISDRGLAYGAVRCFGPELWSERLRGEPPREVAFNFLGTLDHRFGPKHELSVSRSPGHKREHLVDVIAHVDADRLRLEFISDSEVLEAGRAQLMVDASARVLQELATSRHPAGHPAGHRATSSRGRSSHPIGPIGPIGSMQARILDEAAAWAEPGTYHLQLLLRTPGLTPERLRVAWQRLVARHGALRSRFVGSPPLQEQLDVVSESWSATVLPEIDIERVLSADLAQPHDPSLAPLHRLSSFASGQSHYVLWSFHHAMLDGWSSARLLGELRARYEDPSLPSATDSVSSEALLRWLSRQPAGESAWRSIVDADATWPFVLERSPSMSSKPRVRFALDLSREVTSALAARARSCRVTMACVLYAAWGCVLAHCSGSSKLGFGIVDSGRTPAFPASEQITGMICDVLPMMLRIDEAVPVPDWLSSIQSLQTRVRRPVSWSWESRRRFERANGIAYGAVLRLSNYPHGRDEQDGQWRVQAFRDDWHFPVNVVVLPGDALKVRIDARPEAMASSMATALPERLEASLRALAAPSTVVVGDILRAVERGLAFP